MLGHAGEPAGKEGVIRIEYGQIVSLGMREPTHDRGMCTLILLLDEQRSRQRCVPETLADDPGTVVHGTIIDDDQLDIDRIASLDEDRFDGGFDVSGVVVGRNDYGDVHDDSGGV